MMSYDVLDEAFSIGLWEVPGHSAGIMTAPANSGDGRLKKIHIFGWLNPSVRLFYEGHAAVGIPLPDVHEGLTTVWITLRDVHEGLKQYESLCETFMKDLQQYESFCETLWWDEGLATAWFSLWDFLWRTCDSPNPSVRRLWRTCTQYESLCETFMKDLHPVRISLWDVYEGLAPVRISLWDVYEGLATVAQHTWQGKG